MSVTGISSQSSALDILWGYGANSIDPTSESVKKSDQAAGANSRLLKSDFINFSKPAEMLSQLQKLKTEDPAKFKEVVSKIADQVQHASEAEGDSPLGKFLSELAKKLQSVAEGGDLSQLKPKSSTQGASGTQNQYPQSNQLSLVDLLMKKDSRNGTDNSVGQMLSSFFSEVKQAISQ